MESNFVSPVAEKFAELMRAVERVSDDIKIACAEFSLEGDFSQVEKLSITSSHLQAFRKSSEDLYGLWLKSSTNPKHKASCRANVGTKQLHKAPRSKLRVVVFGKEVQSDTAAETFVTVLELIGFDRAAHLGMRLSGIPLVGKTKATGYQTQKQRGSWYITTHASTRALKALLEEIGRKLNVPVRVDIVAGRALN